MTLHSIGEISLSLSTFIYLIWLLPQIWLNYQRKSTDGLSFWLHSLLVFGYCFDLIYGFGRHMEWQYRLVTCAGLATLLIQHLQFGMYGHRSVNKWLYRVVSVFALGLLANVISVVLFEQETKLFYDSAGMISNICFLVYMIPQIIKNYTGRSAAAISWQFMALSLMLTACDMTSAVTLGWDWPSYIGPIIGLSCKLTLVFQLIYYRAPNAATA